MDLSRDRTDWIYLGIKGHLVCIDPADGRERWRTALKGPGLVVPALHGDLVVAHAGGHLFGVERESGRVLWENELKGLGYGHGLIAGAGAGLDPSVVAAVEAAQAATTTAATGAAVSSTAVLGGST